MDRQSYISPFMDRYGIDDMRKLFSDMTRHRIWRDLWYTLAYAESACVDNVITVDHLAEIANALSEDIDYNKVEQYENETHHDVMAHLLEFGDHCPTAKSILHLGATSCYITDNADIIIMREAIALIITKLRDIINRLIHIAEHYSDTPIVGRTHLQKAQLTTIGKRVSMWIQDLCLDYETASYTYRRLRLLGCKGATGSQSSLYTLFDGDYDKAIMLDNTIASAYNMQCIDISGQTYTRKFDSMIADMLSQIAQSASKFATDMRLMSAFGEAYEGFDKKQVGSSAMPYKRNPITCEKICGIARHVICNSQNMAITTSTQWLERTLDDSSNKRIAMAELFLGVSEILRCMESIINNMAIDTDICRKHAEEHSKMASLEDDIIRNVMNGGDRQDSHRDAIWSEGSNNAQVNTGFAKEQTIGFIYKIRERLNKK